MHTFICVTQLYPLLATDPSEKNRNEMVSSLADITAPVTSKLSRNLVYEQYPVAEQSSAESSGYHALKNAFLTLNAVHSDTAQIEMKLQDSTLGDQLFLQETSTWRSFVIESRKRAFAADFIKDALLLHVRGAKKVGYQDITSFDFSRLFLEEAVIVFDSQQSIKAQDQLNAIVALIPDVAKKLAAHPIKKGSGYEYTITREDFKIALQEEVSQKAQTKVRAGIYADFEKSSIIEDYFPTLADVHFTLQAEVNKNTISSADQNGNEKKHMRTYKGTKASLAPLRTLDEMLSTASEQTSSEQTSSEQTSTEQTSSEQTGSDQPSRYPLADKMLEKMLPPLTNDHLAANGDNLAIADLTELSLHEKENPSATFNAEAVSRMPAIQCVDSVKNPSFLQEIENEIKCKSIVNELEIAGPNFSAVMPMNSNGHWISCVVSKKDDKIHLIVTDSMNKDRRSEPGIVMLTQALEDGLKKQGKPKEDKKLKDELFSSLLNAPADTATTPAAEEKDKTFYGAPLDQFSLEELPPLEQFFGGKLPNDIYVRIAQLKAIKEIKSVGTGIKNCLILWGPPGTGKSTIAQIMARIAGREILL